LIAKCIDQIVEYLATKGTIVKDPFDLIKSRPDALVLGHLPKRFATRTMQKQAEYPPGG
jgi:hypothetical protein